MANQIHNPDCCGSHCRSETGQVRVYPLGGGGNLILCVACWEHENQFRRIKGRHYGRPEEWPELNWNDAEIYPEE